MGLLQEFPPKPVVQLIQGRGLDRLPVLFTTSADLALDGRVERHWLAVDSEHVTVVADGSTPRIIHSLAMEKVESFRAQSVVGSGLLQARMNGVWIDLLRYSNALANRFGKVVGKLDEFRIQKRFLLQPEDGIDERRCLTCGLALRFVGDLCPRCIDRGTVVVRVLKLIWPYRCLSLLMCSLIILGVLAELVPPKLQQYLVDHVLRLDGAYVQAESLLILLLAIVGSLAGTRVLLTVVNALKGILGTRIGTAITSDLRAEMVNKLLKFSVDYYDRQPEGVLLSRVAHDTEALHGLIHQFTNGFLLQILQLAGVGLMLFVLNAKLALWTLIPMPFVLYGSWFFWRHVYPNYYRYWDSVSRQVGTLGGILSGIRVVKAFAREDHEFNRFQGSSEILRLSRSRVEISASIFSALMQLIFSLGGLIVWFIGGRDVLENQMTLGTLMAFLAYLTMFYTPLSTLAQFTTWLTSFLTASHRVFELLDTPYRVHDPVQPVKLSEMYGHIRFENATFGYDRRYPVIKDFDWEIRPGEMVGVVGRSGSGKTTLANLICRFYDVDTGRVLIDGYDVRELAREYLRSHIGVVLQEPFLFRGTVWDNLVYGRPLASPEEALTATKEANAHKFIMRLPFGYDTSLGEQGSGLSGGEKQRLSIARALLCDPQVLILDEATSSVDTESEETIQDALTVLTQGRTTIAISHRLSTLRNADRTIVIDQGKLVEEGTHQELLAKNGLYAKFVRIQTQVTADPTLNNLMQVDKQKAKRDREVNAIRRTKISSSSSRCSKHFSQEKNASFAPQWLTPGKAKFRWGEHSTLELTTRGQLFKGIFAVEALPASHAGEFISVGYEDADGKEHEIGLVRQLADWAQEDRILLEQALMRRSYMPVITALKEVKLRHGLLTFQVLTDRGPMRFTMRCSQSQTHDFGQGSKVLIDVDENRFLIKNIEALPRRQQQLFHRFIYW